MIIKTRLIGRNIRYIERYRRNKEHNGNTKKKLNDEEEVEEVMKLGSYIEGGARQIKIRLKNQTATEIIDHMQLTTDQLYDHDHDWYVSPSGHYFVEALLSCVYDCLH